MTMLGNPTILSILLIAIINSKICLSCHSKEKSGNDKIGKASSKYETLYSDKVFKNEYQWEEMKKERTEIITGEATTAYSPVSRSAADRRTTSHNHQVSSGNCDGHSPCIPLSDANERYRTCCQNSKLSNECQKLCDYNITSAEIQKAFATLRCPIKALREIMICASGQKSNQECCNRENLLNGATAVCKPFCNPKSHKWPSTLTEMMKFAPCLDINHRILNCHWASLKP